MSVTESSQSPEQRRTWWRSGPLIIGGVLWLLVLAVLASAWQARRQRELANAERDGATAAEPAVEEPGRARIVLSPNSDGDGQVIDLSDLMRSGGATLDAPEWDPEGVQDFSLTNCDGRTITKADLLGRPWAVCFVFTKCLGPCPLVTRQLKTIQDRLKNYDFRLVTLTVDPARDTPEVLLNYAKLNGADLRRWYFLSGDQAAIYGLIHDSFRMPVQEVTGPDRREGFEVIHSTNVMLVDADGVVRAKFNAAKDEEMASLRRELQKLASKISAAEPDAVEAVTQANDASAAAPAAAVTKTPAP